MVQNIMFLDLFLQCKGVLSGEISDDDFGKYLADNLVVDKYLTVGYKKKLVDVFFLVHDDSVNDFSDMALIYEVYSVLGFLLSYTNIEISPDEMTEDNYDIIVSSGLADYILRFCEKDYNRLKDMCMSAIEFKNSLRIDIISNFEPEVMEKLIGETRGMFEGMTSDKLALMKDIMEYNDPATKQLKNAIYTPEKKQKTLLDLKE